MYSQLLIFITSLRGMVYAFRDSLEIFKELGVKAERSSLEERG
jgi:hypothetical protein